MDTELIFENHITELCVKVSQTFNPLCRISYFMSIKKHRLLVKAFIESQFNYCPLLWILHSRNVNNKIIAFTREH